MMMVVMVAISEGWTCERQREQYCRKNLLHKSNPSMDFVACRRAHVTDVPREKRVDFAAAGMPRASFKSDAIKVHLDYDDASRNFPKSEPSALLF
jgi:hypothetical protein